MATRLPPKAMAKKLVRILRAQHPDYRYLKKVFQHTRELLDVIVTSHKIRMVRPSRVFILHRTIPPRT